MGAMDKIRVLMLGSDSVFFEGLKSVLNESGSYNVHERFNGSASACAVAKHAGAELILIDWSGAGGKTMDSLRELRAALPTGKIVVFGNDVSDDLTSETATNLLDAFLSKDLCPDALQRAVALILLGQQIFPARFVIAAIKKGAQPLADSPATLSPQETKIMQSLAAGLSNKQIARELGLAEATVKVHLRNASRKVRASNRTQAAIWAVSHGLPNGGNGLAASHGPEG